MAAGKTCDHSRRFRSLPRGLGQSGGGFRKAPGSGPLLDGVFGKKRGIVLKIIN